MKSTRRQAALGLLVALLSTPPGALSGAVITVEGACTLVDAIQAANFDQAVGDCAAGDPGEDVVVLTGDVSVTETHNQLDGPNGLPSIRSEVTIEGGGFTVARDSAEEFRVMHVSSDGTLTLRDLAVTNGRTRSQSLGGGGILNRGLLVLERSDLTDNSALYRTGGGLANLGEAVLVDSTVDANDASSVGGIDNLGGADLTLVRTLVKGNVGLGAGGLFNAGTATLVDSELQNNLSCCDLGEEAGGMSNSGTATLIRTTVSGSSADVAGGIDNFGNMTLIQSTVRENRVNGAYYANGGGIRNTAKLRIVLSTIAENTGAPFYVTEGAGILNRGELILENSTVSGNTGGTFGGRGGGLFNAGTASIVNSTVVGNHAGNGANGQGDQIHSDSGSVTLRNSIIAHTAASVIENCTGDGEILDAGGNFTEDGSCAQAAPIQPGLDFDLTLADNGGSTATHALLPGSVAIDAGVDCDRVLDQRALTRDAACDSGSYELGALDPVAPSLRVSGACPGEIEIAVVGATANGAVALAGSLVAGPATGISTGLCAGSVLDMVEARQLTLITVDDRGNGLITRTVGDPACGATVQAVDLVTCGVSSAAGVP